MTKGLLSIQLSSGPRRGGLWVLWYLYGVLGLWALVIVYFFVTSPPSIRFIALLGFMPWIPSMIAVLLIRAYYRGQPVLEFTDSAVAFRWRIAPCEVPWRDATGLFLPAKFGAIKAKAFPRVLILKTDHVIEPSAFGRVGTVIALQPGGGVSLTTEIQYLTEFIGRAPARIVDPEVLLLLGLALRLANQHLPSLDPADTAVRELLQHPTPVTAAITAPFEYFLGNVEKARAQCLAGLKAEPNAWELLLCRALCERALGDGASAGASMTVAAAADSPSEVAPVLAHAAGSE